MRPVTELCGSYMLVNGQWTRNPYLTLAVLTRLYLLGRIGGRNRARAPRKLTGGAV